MPDRAVIYVGDEEGAQVACNLPRPDLKDWVSGIGDGGSFCAPGRRRSQTVTVRALWSGELLPRVPNASEKASRYYSGSFDQPIHAIVPLSAPVVTSPGASLRNSGGVGSPGAILGVEPAPDWRDARVDQVQWSEAPIEPRLKVHLSHKHLAFEAQLPSDSRQYIAFEILWI